MIMEQKEVATAEVAVVKANVMTMVAELTDALKGLKSLDEAEASDIDLVMEYWTPEEIGEKRRGYFVGLRTEMMTSIDTGVETELTVAIFVRPMNGKMCFFKNGSRRLVGVIEALGIEPNTPLELTYNGKKKNKSNSFTSDTWSLKPIIMK